MIYRFKFFLTLLFIFSLSLVKANAILVPMDISQKNHLKAYGVSFWALENNIVIEWLLNYQGGSFLYPYNKAIE